MIRRLRLPMPDLEQKFRRMVFNIVASNQRDRAGSIAILMDKPACWSLSPAFDPTYGRNPQRAWTANHQTALNGKRDGLAMDDFKQCANAATLKRGRSERAWRKRSQR